LVSLFILGLLYLINLRIPLDNIGKSGRCFIWILIYLATQFLINSITKFKKRMKKKIERYSSLWNYLIAIKNAQEEITN
jgi:hypothetical protein